MPGQGLATRLAVWVVGLVLVAGTVVFYIGYAENRRVLEAHANRLAGLGSAALANDLDTLARGVEQATRQLAAAIAHAPADPDPSRALLRALVAADPAIAGATLAFAPAAFVAGTDLAIRVERTGGGLRHVDLATDAPGFRDAPWYREPATSGVEGWTEPHGDPASAQRVSFSVPLHETVEGGQRLRAVVSADVALARLRGHADAQVAALGGDLHLLLLSRSGRAVGGVNLLDEPPGHGGLHPEPLPRRAAERGREDVRVVAERMLRGESGAATLVAQGRVTRQWLHFRPLLLTGWSLAVVADEARLLASIEEAERRQVVAVVVVAALAGLLVVAVVRRFEAARTAGFETRDAG